MLRGGVGGAGAPFGCLGVLHKALEALHVPADALGGEFNLQGFGAMHVSKLVVSFCSQNTRRRTFRSTSLAAMSLSLSSSSLSSAPACARVSTAPDMLRRGRLRKRRARGSSPVDADQPLLLLALAEVVVLLVLLMVVRRELRLRARLLSFGRGASVGAGADTGGSVFCCLSGAVLLVLDVLAVAVEVPSALFLSRCLLAHKRG